MVISFRAATLAAIAALAAGCGGPEPESFVIPEGRVTVETPAAGETAPPAEENAGAQDPAAAPSPGLATELPEYTPDDLPRYPGMTLHSVTATPAPLNIIYQAEVTVGTVGAIGWFSSETERLGWKRKDGITQPDFAYANYEKDGRTMNVNINSGDPQTGSGTILTVVYAE